MSEDRARKYAEWIVANQSKRGTPEFETVAKAYQAARTQMGGALAAPAAPAAPSNLPLGQSESVSPLGGQPLAQSPEALQAALSGDQAAFAAANSRDMMAGAGAGGATGAPVQTRDWRDRTVGGLASLMAFPTFGFYDEAVGGLNALASLATDESMSDAYARGRDFVRSSESSFAENNPVTSTGLNIAGAIPTALVSTPARVLQGAGTLGSRVGLSALAGSGVGAVTGFGQGEGGVGNRIVGGISGGAVGALGGAAGELIGTGLQAAARNVVARFGGGTRLVDPSGNFTPQGIEALRAAGIDPANVTPDLARAVAEEARRAAGPGASVLADPAAVARAAEARALPVPVPLSRGQALADPDAQMFEDLARKGGYGDMARQPLVRLEELQRSAIDENIGTIQGQLSGGAAPQVNYRGQGGEIVSRALTDVADAGRARVNAAYDTAREMGGRAGLPRDAGVTMAQDVAASVANDFDLAAVPNVGREIERLRGAATAGDMPVQALYEARRRLSNLRTGNTPEAVAAGRAVAALDRSIVSAVDNALIQGDEAAVQAWRSAIGEARSFKQMFGGRDTFDRLVQRDPQNNFQLRVSPEQAANFLLGSSDLAFVNKPELLRSVRRIEGALREANPGAWNALREEVFLRIAQRGEPMTNTALSGAERQLNGGAILNAWEAFTTKNAPLANALFTAEERATIGRLARVAATVTQPVRGGAVNSTTALAMRNMAARAISAVPGISNIAQWLVTGLGNMAKAAQAVQATGGRLPATPVRGGMLAGPLTAASALGATAPAIGTLTQERPPQIQ